MAFDPDAYLSQDKAFDPDAYLQPEAQYGPEETATRERLLTDRGFDIGRAISQSAVGRMFGGQSPREQIATARLRDIAPQESVFARDLPEIGEAPELRELTRDSMQRGFAAGLISNEAELADAIQKLTPGAEILQDPEGHALIKFPSGETYAVNKPGLSGQDFVQFASRALAFIPAGRASSLVGAGLKSGVTESGLQAVEAGVGGEFTPSEVGLAAGLGAGAKGLEKVAGSIYRGTTGGAASDVVEAAEGAGIPTMTTDIIPPETFAGKMAQQTGEKIPISGTGALRQEQQAMREAAVSDMAARYEQFSYADIVKSLKDQKDKVKSAAGSVLDRTGKQLDDVGQIPTGRTRTAIATARSELNKPGVIKSPDALAEIDSLVSVLDEAPQTFTSLKENRTLFREMVKKADKAERSQLTSRAKSLLQSIERGMTDDMTRMAKENLTPSEFSKWKKANSVYAEEAQKLTRSRLKNVLDSGDITPESVDNLLFSKKPSEVNLLYKSLTNEGRKNARAAIISKVVGDLNRRASGMTPNSFASEMKKYGLQTGTFFKGEEKSALNGLLKALNATRRAQDAAITTQTGQQLLGAGTLAAAATDLGATLGLGGTAGGFARLYESAPVRNALLRLNSAPAGSTKFEQALSELDELLLPLAQSARSQQSDTQ